MKFFNKKALTLVELITSLVIIGSLIVVIFVFVTTSVEELADNSVKINSTQDFLSFQEIISNFVNSGYSNGEIISSINDGSYTGTTNPSPNGILYLKKADGTAGILVGIVDLNTKKIQKNYVYGDNFLGYRELSQSEVSEIDDNNNLVFDKIFQNDKMFLNLRIKDFILEYYNNEKIIELYVNIVKKFDESLFGVDFADLDVDNLIIGEYSLTF